MTDTIKARNLSCQAIALHFDPATHTFHGKPVEGYEEEISRRGEGHIYGCELIGHGLPEHTETEQIRRHYGDFTGLYDQSQAVAHVRVLLTEVERLRAREADDAGWNEAIDWLLNSRHTGDPDIQTAFWNLVDGRCTRDEADSGYMADGRTMAEVQSGAEAANPT